MKLRPSLAVAALSLTLVGGLFTQQSSTNEDSRKETKAALKQQKKTDKDQAKADKQEEKLAGSKQAKKAARAQDKANATAAGTPQPQ